MPGKQESTQEKIINLTEQIRRHRYLYYNEQPEISDAKYDAIEDELKELDPENPILFKIGVDSSELFTDREHIIPMTSQDKVDTPQKFLKWAKKRNYKTFIVQFKLDGISIELQYENGIFQYAVTRGDGKVGNDITANVIKMKGFFPITDTQFTGAVRAEILLFRDIFSQKYSDKKNCRNAAGGIARRKDGVGCGDLNLIYYDAISLDNSTVFSSEIQKLKWLKEQKFPTVPTKTVNSPDGVIDIRKEMVDGKRDALNYDIDGLVIKGKQIDLEDMKRTKPIKQIAFKFNPSGIETLLIDVIWSINGPNYTPVAKLEKVEFLGGKLENPSLSNPDKIKRLGIKIPCRVIATKGGEIIPDILEVVKVLANAKEVEIPQICEVCKTQIMNIGTRVYCPNEACPKRAYHRLVKWIAKLNVKHFGENSILRPLFDSGKAKSIADLYSLEVSHLTQFEGVGETSAKKALGNLFAVKKVSLARFIGGFDIENIGEDLTQRVVDAGYDTLKKIRDASIFQLSQVDGFAELTAQYLQEGVEKLYPQMKDLLNTNKIEIEEVKEMGGKLEGISFCITGSLENFKPRSKAEELVIKLGGIVKKNVTKDLNYLVTNSDEPTKKYSTAQSQPNTEIISEEEFMKMVE